MHEETSSFLSSAKRYTYIGGIYCKKFLHFLYRYKKYVLYCVGALLCSAIAAQQLSEIARISKAAGHQPFGVIGVFDYLLLQYYPRKLE